MAPLKILIIDEDKFIGKHLSTKMCELGYQAHIIDALDKSNILSTIEDWAYVVYVSCRPRAPFQASFNLKVDFEQTLLTACIAAQVKKLVYVSSTYVYGDPPPSRIITEESPYLSSLNPLVSMLQASERLILRANPAALEAVVLQPGTVYGPGEDGESAHVLSQMQTNFVPLMRDGTGYCNPIYIDDVLSAIIKACETPNLHGQKFIISTDQTVSWREFLCFYESILGNKTLIALPIDSSYRSQGSVPFIKSFLFKMLLKRKIADETGRLSKIIWGKSIYYPSIDEFWRLVAQPIFCNQKSRDRLNFSPQISLPVGMEKVRNWWQRRL
jgi:nucleoside-diphosphate-sugar epimerase